MGLWGIGLESTLCSFVYINWTLQQFNPITHTSFLCGGKIQINDNIKIFGRLQCFKQEKEEISQRKHWWTKQRECIYELLLKTREPDDEAWECHISSSGQKHQQRRGALWFKLKLGAQRKINGRQEYQSLVDRGLDEVELTRASVNLVRTGEEGSVRISFPLRSMYDTPISFKLATVGTKPRPKL